MSVHNYVRAGLWAYLFQLGRVKFSPQFKIRSDRTVCTRTTILCFDI